MVLNMIITDVLDQIIVADCPSEVWKQSEFIVGPIESLKNTTQRNNQTVFDHTMTVLDCLPIKNHTTILAVLFHDTGKPRTRTVIGEKINFRNHEIESYKIATKSLKLLGINGDTTKDVLGIIITHMFDVVPKIGRPAMRNLIAKIGRDNIDNWFAVREADAICYRGYGLGPKAYICAILESFRKRVDEELGDEQSSNVIDQLSVGSQIIMTGEKSAED